MTVESFEYGEKCSPVPSMRKPTTHAVRPLVASAAKQVWYIVLVGH